ncbi:hypothetical protein B0H66DRAFT_29482 [Apodospora peruviana]|uniref:Uncharacterized protein n=1 Tax=Apodospora peruviana TaxID=516989 RepID=A0AAE0IR76_9PEZI|nr:hypothetical protein B0H66DRAFT_29482 [Apodospora peruviana]
MNGPTLTMAPAAVQMSTPFHRSRSTPDLLSAVPAVPNKPPPSAISSQSLARANSLKTLPSLPAFDVPSFDLSAEFDSSFSFRAKDDSRRRSIPKQEVAEVKVEAPSTATLAADTETLSRSRSMIDRPRSWLPSSKSSPDVRNIQSQRPSRPTTHNGSGAPEDAPAPKPMERSRTVESFADFAKRTWISSSRSPSPPSKAEKLLGADRAAAQRHESSMAKTKGKAGLGGRKLSGSRTLVNLDPDAARSTESLSSTSRALNRASVYLTKIKQKPQSVFSKSASSLSLSASSVKSARSTDSDSTAPSAPSAATTTDNSGSTTTTNTTRASATTTTTATATATTTKLLSSSVRNNVSNNINDSLTPRNSSHTASSLDTTATSENSSQATTDTGITMPHPTSHDPLWSTFRTLDVDFAKFAAKPTASGRMGVVRYTLLPFLRSTSHHPSNSNRSLLSHEDFDRRATILNKWWNGLLEMLDAGQSRMGNSAFGLATNSGTAGGQLSGMGTNLQPVPGVDRPTVLEATTMIMMRPEWRVCTSYFQPLAERSPEERVRARSGTASTVDSSVLDSSTSEFLAQSVEHNIRNMFVANLLTQMALVVDKMSMRHAPTSLVNWCGKACAYAFFFAPGIADVLVRLWVLNADLLRRVADEFGLPRRSKGESEDIIALFPPHLGKLGWTSVKTLGDKLRLAAKLPLMPAKIPWHGPWVSRWRGGDTDLFYIFCKYYYILAEEFMPEGLPLVEKARAPAFVLVHAQLLATLDSTIHRHASMEAMMGPPLSDALHGADAALTGLPLPSNLLRGMDENRLIILLRDMLAENSTGLGTGIKHAFAEAFMSIMKAATKRTSRYEHAACFMLCDFLEEALTTFDTFQNTLNNSIATSPTEETAPSFEIVGASAPVDHIDWPFWFDVGKMIMDSNNTMSEIRIMSFVFSLWDAITADPARKAALVFDWLLTEEIFEKFFNNWCPMVRAYYMRLLCWRICRDSGSANELDVKIFLVVSERLNTVWSHYLWMKQKAEAENRIPPSTAPSYPTPGKRFLIIRTEVQPPPPHLLLGFDPLSSSLSGPGPVVDFPGAASGNSESTANDGKADTTYKKKWSLLGKVLSFTASQANIGMSNGHSGGRRSWDEELEQARRETAAMRTAAARSGQPGGPPPPPKQSPSTAVLPSSDSGSSTGSAPIYEASTFVFRFSLTWQGQNSGPRDRILVRPRLPAPAQSRVSTRSATLNANESGKGALARRSDSPPPISPGLPPETRRVSGLMHTGLVSEARNARRLSVGGTTIKQDQEKIMDKRMSLSIDVTTIRLVSETTDDDDRLHIQSPTRVSGSESSELDRGRSLDPEGEIVRSQSSAHAVRPVGIYGPGAVYSGRSLAEWSLVVSECNSFVDRRRDEGVLGLNEVEVPTLGVEGLGLRQRA